MVNNVVAQKLLCAVKVLLEVREKE